MCGLVRPVFRLPYVPLSREQREHGAQLLRAVQEHIPGCKVREGRVSVSVERNAASGALSFLQQQTQAG